GPPGQRGGRPGPDAPGGVEEELSAFSPLPRCRGRGASFFPPLSMYSWGEGHGGEGVWHQRCARPPHPDPLPRSTEGEGEEKALPAHRGEGRSQPRDDPMKLPRFFVGVGLVALVALTTVTPPRAYAYVEAPHSMGQIINLSTNVVLMQVEAVD